MTARRLATAAIVAQLAGRRLSPLELRRLADLMSTEIDPVVWQQALRIVREDGRDAAQRLACLAIDHTSPDVRRQACEYLSLHADPRHAALLIPLLKDTNSTVVLAAVRAIAAGQTIDDPRPLIELLVTPDKLLRAEVALALARLRVPQGTDALQRLALETDQQIRIRIATGIGELRDTALVPILVGMLDDRPDVQRAAVHSLQEIIGSDGGIVDSSKPETLEQQVRRWRQWHRDRQAAEARG
jgi:HEAT repeat protein